MEEEPVCAWTDADQKLYVHIQTYHQNQTDTPASLVLAGAVAGSRCAKV